MGNTLPQLSAHRSLRTSKSKPTHPSLKKSRSLREYTRSTPPADKHHRRAMPPARPQSMPPTDAEIVDIRALRCPASGADEGEEQLFRQLDYIRSCVRKDKGLFGKMTENLQNKHIFSHDEPENTHILEQTPDDYHMDYQSVYLQTFDGEFIHAYWIYQGGDVNDTTTLLYFHGAGGNISHRLEVLQLFYENLHCNILVIDYRGFGKSTGTPSELGLYIDAQTSYDYLIYKQKILPENIVVLGTSLGASVAIQLVSDPVNRVKVAMFENAFISVPEVAKYFLTYAKGVLGVTKSIGFIYLFDSLAKVRRIECPCVYLTGLLDPLIPTWMSTTLYNETLAASKRQLYEYPFGKHNDLPVMRDYFENIHAFLNELAASKSETEPLVLRQ